MSRVAQHLRRVTLHDEPDRALLDRFIHQRDEAAFTVLVRRHGPMVLGVCQRILRNRHDAEDAFQATYLVLARRAHTLRNQEQLNGWLYGVAYRTALRARAMTARRREKERQAARPDLVPHVLQDDVADVLDEELNRLPEHYRLPVILCDLQGQSRQAAAETLGVPVGTLSSRLTVARKRLAGRLTRRGVTLGAVTAVAVPSSLVQATAQAAVGEAGVVSTYVVVLAEGVVKALYVANLCRASAIAVALLAAMGTTGRLLWPAMAQEPPAQASQPPRPVPAAPARAPIEPREVFVQALDAAGSIQDAQWKAWMFQAIGEAQTKAGDNKAALQTLRKAVEAAKQITPDHRKDHTLCWIVGALAAAGAVKEATETAQAIEQDDSREYGLSNIAVAQAKAGDFQSALEMAQRGGRLMGQALRQVAEAQAEGGQVKEALALAETIGEDANRALAFAFIAQAQFRSGDPAGARKTLQAALKVGDTLQDPEGGDWRSSTLGQLASVQALLGEARAARKLAESIKPEMWRSGGLKLVAEAQCKLGDLDAARDTAEAIPLSYYKGEALCLVVEALYAAGKADAARKTAETIWHPRWQLHALGALGKDLARRGEWDEAAQTFAKALAQAKDIPDEEPGSGNHRNATRAHLVQVQAEAGQAREALAWVHQQVDPLLRCQAFLNIAEGLTAREAAKKASPK